VRGSVADAQDVEEAAGASGAGAVNRRHLVRIHLILTRPGIEDKEFAFVFGFEFRPQMLVIVSLSASDELVAVESRCGHA
jgi:hypothetical protein